MYSIARSQSRTVQRRRRVLTIGHSYCVFLNRRLVHEMTRQSGAYWDITAVAPKSFRGDLRLIHLEETENECRLESVPVHLASRIHFMLYGRELANILRRKWDLIHCWEEPYIVAGGQVAFLAARQARIVFFTAQNIDKRYPPPFRLIERFCLERCAGWLAAGECVKQTLLQRGYGCKPHRVMPLGVDVNLFRPNPDARSRVRTDFNWQDTRIPVIGFVGRFVSEKGLDLLMAVLDQVHVPWRALFVGGGPLENRLREWATRYGERVKIVTGVLHHDVPAYINSMDLLCAPSQTTPYWREQFGRMLIEAFACGIPVIASDSGEIPYVVKDAGMIVSEQDQTGWRNSITALLESSEQRTLLGAAGMERAHAEYSWSKIARRHLEFFDELLDAPNPVAFSA